MRALDIKNDLERLRKVSEMADEAAKELLGRQMRRRGPVGVETVMTRLGESEIAIVDEMSHWMASFMKATEGHRPQVVYAAGGFYHWHTPSQTYRVQTPIFTSVPSERRIQECDVCMAHRRRNSSRKATRLNQPWRRRRGHR